ncbi:L,D-transpeptidase family protein [Kribbella sandramycini]|uniref:L,D-transpeptidase family protein n=1 Tax=Kribbella sandramycini TaxID=60450 RepID=A0A7Y4L8I5_9ACTN|nr:L,D-transpeptidase family protein [Kribbella sandramycini]MBB6570451.1 lipoprotein-anchoring transpeptidase ErfK/SrfK [Kribbella sandramycini]NOL45311.1 L,D-transpeptidase family protein [Kribbella sandramycini]
MSRRRGLTAGAVVLSFVLAGCSDVAASEPTAKPSTDGSTSSTPPPSTPAPSTPTAPTTGTPTSTPPSATPTTKPTPSVKPTTKPKNPHKPQYYALKVEQKLEKLGYPVGDVDGKISVRARQALCAWREHNGLPINRKGLSLPDAYSVINATAKPTPAREDGIYVNKTCQILYQIVNKQYKRIVWISTGAPGYDTPNRTGKVWRKWAGAHESSLYDDAYMYDSIYFLKDRPGIALHGSRVNSLIKPYPASHRCVRVMRPQIHQIFADTPIGTKVQVYGNY